VLEPSPTRERLTSGLVHGSGDDPIATLDRAWKATVAAEPLTAKLRAAHIHTWKEGLAKKALTQAEADALRDVEDEVSKVIAVDDFAPEELTHHDSVTTIR
jgi:hypothetical protein